MRRAPFHLEIPIDEVPFSTVARYALIGGLRAPIALQQIFRNRKKRIHPYLPGCMKLFANFFDLCPEAVIKNKTIFPLVAFAQPATAQTIAFAMQMKTDDQVINNTAIAHSRFTIFYGLKCCPKCIEEDTGSLGFTYWHVLHQIPGIEACHKHHCMLVSIAMGDGRRDRTLFLPDFCAPKTVMATDSQVRLAVFTADLCKQLQYRQADFHIAYRYLLLQRELISSSGKYIQTSKVCHILSEYWGSLPFSDHLGLGVPRQLSDFTFIGPLLRNKTGCPAHPVKHMLLACWLTNGNASNLFNFSSSHPINVDAGEGQKSNTDQLVLTLLKREKSFNEIERLTDRSRCYIRRVAELNRITHKSNSLRYSETTRRSVLVKAIYGVSCKVIAETLGVGVGYVEQVICNEPNVSNWRKHLRIQKNVLAACNRLARICKEHPDWCRTKIRQKAQAEYFLLYNHDKSLIEKVLPKPMKPKTYRKDWAQEDIRLCTEISKLNGIENLSLSAIGRLVNDHGYLRRALNKLPKTRSLLKKLGK
jgi:hypothetical protein